MGLVLRSITAVWLVSFSGLSAQVVRSEQTGTPFTLRAYPARWVLSGEGDTLIVPNLRLADLAGKSWEVVVLKNGERGVYHLAPGHLYRGGNSFSYLVCWDWVGQNPN